MTDITKNDAGCWLDGHMGWHNHRRVVMIAHGLGMPLDADELKLINDYQQDEENSVSTGDALDRGEAVIGQGGLVDKATEYLESQAPEGYHFEWDMGELSMLPCSEIEGDECERLG